MKILAVVVTHDRRELLGRCLAALQAQVRPPDAIAVVDNGSSDGTAEMLERMGVRRIAQANVGSAGGWYRGIELGQDEAYDAVWLMDDDGFPDPLALQRLEPALSDGVACASSVVLCEGDRTRFVFPFPRLGPNGLPVLFRWPRKFKTIGQLASHCTDGMYPFAHLFNGALLSVAATRRAGNIEREFFIFGDEVDYFFRLRAQGAVVSVLSARHYHPDVASRPYTPAKVYYYVRNTLVLNRRYFDKIFLRDVLAVVIVMARTLRRNGLGTMLSYLIGPRSGTLRRAVHRGSAGKLGVDFNA